MNQPKFERLSYLLLTVRKEQMMPSVMLSARELSDQLKPKPQETPNLTKANPQRAPLLT